MESWYIHPDEKQDLGSVPVVIFAHGNAESIDEWPYKLSRFKELGIGLLLVEHPGYGRSGGRPSEDNITKTMVSAHNMITRGKDVDSERIVLMGRPLGGGAVCQLTKSHPFKAMVLMSTFTTARSQNDT